MVCSKNNSVNVLTLVDLVKQDTPLGDAAFFWFNVEAFQNDFLWINRHTSLLFSLPVVNIRGVDKLYHSLIKLHSRSQVEY